MNEQTARDVVLVRAIETADASREIWSDADRVWATRTTAEIVGDSAADDAFLGRRATLVLERLAERFPRVQRAIAGSIASRAGSRPLRRSSRSSSAPPASTSALRIGSTCSRRRCWRCSSGISPSTSALAVAALAPQRLSRRKAATGPIRHTIIAALRDASRPLRKSIASRPLAAALGRFAADWTDARDAALAAARARGCCIFGAAMLAAGAIAGLYLRGIALEYRAGWQSTFLDAGDVAGLLHVVLAPGAWLTGIAIPGADHLRTIAGGEPRRECGAVDSSVRGDAPADRHRSAACAGRRCAACASAGSRGAFRSRSSQPYFQRLLHASRRRNRACDRAAVQFRDRRRESRWARETADAGVPVGRRRRVATRRSRMATMRFPIFPHRRLPASSPSSI